MRDEPRPRIAGMRRATFVLTFAVAAWSGGIGEATEPLALRAGPLSLVFEPELAFVRHLRVGGVEVLNGISAPVRNRFWGTVPPEVTIVDLDRGADRFTLTFDVHCREREVDFRWRGTLVGRPDGSLDYTFDGESLSDFDRNRIGFCVLHGQAAAGRPWLLEKTDGETVRGAFPERIAPHQPAKDLRAVSHEFAPGSWARVAFEGDVFEMEDQRNWTDASFKTYCTPLALPYPVRVAKGTKVRQRVTLALEGDMPAPAPAVEKDTPVTIDVGDDVAGLPGLGVRLSSQFDDLRDEEIERLAALHLDHLRVDLTPANGDCAAQLRRAIEQARSLHTKLVAGLHLGTDVDAELEAVAAECRSLRPPVAVWLVMPADEAVFARARERLSPVFPEARFGIGHDTNFTELNRDRPRLSGMDVVSYGLNPQVHAFDETSIIETLPIQAETVRTARTFLGDLPILVSPVTLRVQAVAREPLPGELPSNVDPRQASPFAAGWTAGSIDVLAKAGASRVTYYETVGWKGLMAAGAVYPLYHVLHAVGDFAGGRVRKISSTDPAAIVGLALDHDGRRRLLVANLTEGPQRVLIRGGGDEAAVQLLGGAAGWKPMSPAPVSLAAPIELPPYGITRLDGLRR